MTTIEQKLNAILEETPLYELIGRLGEVCQDKANEADNMDYSDIAGKLKEVSEAAEALGL